MVFKNRLSILKKTKVVFYPYLNAVLNHVNQDIEINNQPVHYVNSYLYLGKLDQCKIKSSLRYCKKNYVR